MRLIAILALSVLPAWALAQDDHAEDDMHAEHAEGEHDAHDEHAEGEHDAHEEHAEGEHDEHEEHEEHAEGEMHADHAEDGQDDHLAELDGLRIIHGWSRATRGPEAQVFMEIENTRDAAVLLTGAEADWAESAKLMGAPINAGGEPLMLSEMEIAAGSDFDLTPDTVYILLDGIESALDEGDSLEMEVEFAGLGHVEIVVQVEAANARQHSHVGHAH